MRVIDHPDGDYSSFTEISVDTADICDDSIIIEVEGEGESKGTSTTVAEEEDDDDHHDRRRRHPHRHHKHHHHEKEKQQEMTTTTTMMMEQQLTTLQVKVSALEHTNLQQQKQIVELKQHQKDKNQFVKRVAITLLLLCSTQTMLSSFSFFYGNRSNTKVSGRDIDKQINDIVDTMMIKNEQLMENFLMSHERGLASRFMILQEGIISQLEENNFTRNDDASIDNDDDDDEKMKEHDMTMTTMMMESFDEKFKDQMNNFENKIIHAIRHDDVKKGKEEDSHHHHHQVYHQLEDVIQEGYSDLSHRMEKIEQKLGRAKKKIDTRLRSFKEDIITELVKVVQQQQQQEQERRQRNGDEIIPSDNKNSIVTTSTKNECSMKNDDTDDDYDGHTDEKSNWNEEIGIRLQSLEEGMTKARKVTDKKMNRLEKLILANSGSSSSHDDDVSSRTLMDTIQLGQTQIVDRLEALEEKIINATTNMKNSEMNQLKKLISEGLIINNGDKSTTTEKDNVDNDDYDEEEEEATNDTKIFTMTNFINELDTSLILLDKLPSLDSWKGMWDDTSTTTTMTMKEIEMVDVRLADLGTKTGTYNEMIHLLKSKTSELSDAFQNRHVRHVWRGTNSDIAIGNGEKSYQSYILDSPLMTMGNIYEWTMHVHKFEYDGSYGNGYIFMGIASNQRPFRPTTRIGYHNDGSWGYRHDGLLFHDARCIQNSLPSYGNDSTVHFRLDLTTTSGGGTLHAWQTDDENQVHAYTLVETNILNKVKQLDDNNKKNNKKKKIKINDDDKINNEDGDDKNLDGSMMVVGFQPVVTISYNSQVQFVGF